MEMFSVSRRSRCCAKGTEIAAKLADFSKSPPTVRSIVCDLRHKQEAQTIVLESCLTRAKKSRQNATASTWSSSSSLTSSAGITDTSPLLPPITEIASRSETSTTATSLPLSGVVVSVTDCLDVTGFQTKYGVDCKMLHRAPRKDSPFVHWLRSNGAQFVGKLRCHTPLSFRENSVLRNDLPAGLSIETRSCHYAISNSIVGAASLMAPLYHDVASFKPTMSAFGYHGFRFAGGCHSIGVTARYLDDLAFLWEVYTCGGGSNALSSSSRSTDAPHYHSAGGRRREAGGTNSYEASGSCSDTTVMMGRFNEEDDVLTIGIPTAWVDSHASMSGEAFMNRMRELCSRNVKGKKGESVEFQSVNIPFDLDSVLPMVKTIADYEVASKLLKFSEGSSGLLEELPDNFVSAVFSGKKISEHEYMAAKLCVDNIARGIEEQFVDVDVICCPLLSTPFQDGNMRSASLTLPFALVGNPMVSLQLDPVESPISTARRSITSDGSVTGFPVQLIGELGRDSGLLDECTSLMTFIEKPKSWWASSSWFRG